MAEHVCLNGSMVNTNNFSSPVPVIGLYIAAVSLVCFLLIICDVWSGFRSKKLWFPCRFFSFNSITLTLISVAAKIPVDLTTSMPSQQDQLAKLSGTVFICMTLSFMLPSTSINAEFESYANVTALSIFVITVVVNVCIQIATGVIFSFIVEHAIILFCMLFMLIRFWSWVTSINCIKRNYTDTNRDFLSNGEKNMSARLKLCYLYSYHSCLQLFSCRAPILADVGVACISCSMVLVEATVRSSVFKDLMFCRGVSDYGWSMWFVVASQILTVVVVSLVIGFRILLTFAHYVTFPITAFHFKIGEPYVEFHYLFTLKNLPKFLDKSFHYVILNQLKLLDGGILLLNFIVHWVVFHVMAVLGCGLLNNETNQGEGEKLKVLKEKLESRPQVFVEDWLLKIGVADYERWLKINYKSSLQHLTRLLSTTPPSEEPIVCSSGQGIKISSLSIVLIANTMMTMPKTNSNVNVASILREVFEIIHLVDDTLNVQSSTDRLQSMLAKTIHKYGLFSTKYSTERLLEEILDPKYQIQNVLPPPRENSKLFSYYKNLPTADDETISSTTRQINYFINQINGVISQQLHPSNEVRYGRLKQLFVDMLHAFLAQLPVAVFTHILESPIEEYHERVRLGLGFICKLQPLESHIRFLLPSGCNITSLFEAQTSTTEMPTEDLRTQVQTTTDPTTSYEVDSVAETEDDSHAVEQQV